MQCLYVNSFFRVSWGGYFSEYFRAENGVKQGGVLSPVVFCVYLDALLIELHAEKVGCIVCIGEYFVGYADDLVLIAPSATALRCMLSVCDKYAILYVLQCC
jgi:Reverse transcriptase (RNA-dependent DNA polymerase)